MPRNEEHELQLQPTPEQAARQRFVLALKQDIGRRLRPDLRGAISPDIPPDNDRAIATALESTFARRFWSRLSRSAQELMWESVRAPLEANEESLTRRCEELATRAEAGGSLELNPRLQYPPRWRKSRSTCSLGAIRWNATPATSWPAPCTRPAGRCIPRASPSGWARARQSW